MPIQTLPVHGTTLVDFKGLPRFWAAVWSQFELSGIAASTRRDRLMHVDAFYAHADETHGHGALDDALAGVELDRLGEMLEAFFLALKNRPAPTAYAEARWRASLMFVKQTCERIGRTSANPKTLGAIEVRLNALDRLYSQLRTSRHQRTQHVRSLPSSVLAELYDHATPNGATNPFSDESTQWRFWMVFVMLLHQGLRRGELLTLPIDALRSERHNGQVRWWMNVKTNEYEDDPRYSKPSIKTITSIRQLPVSGTTAKLVQAYVDNYRGKPAHSFLVNSQRNTPLSAEGLGKGLHKLGATLSTESKKLLADRIGRATISAHDLRHTCAVVRLNQLLKNGDPMPEALQKLRVFFGWSPTSEMPQRYARAVFESRLASVWNDAFDDRVDFIRALPEVDND